MRGEVVGTRERETTTVRRSTYYLWVLLLVLILSLRKLRGFLLYGFLEENSLCLLSLVIIAVHVILSDKILRSFCLNDKNVTCFSPTYYSTCGMEDLSPLEPLLDKPPCLFVSRL